MKLTTILTGIVVFCLVSPLAMAWTQFNDGGTHDIDTEINDDVWVDWEAPAMGTTLTFLYDGFVTGDLKGFENSIINFTWAGQRSAGPVEIYDYSQVHLLPGGNIGSLSLHDYSGVDFTGYSQITVLYAYDYSQVDFSTAPSGNVGSIYAYDHSRIDLSSGYTGNLFAYGNSHMDIGGSPGGSVRAHESSRVTILSGAEISGGLFASDNSRITVFGGSINGELVAYGDSVLTLVGSDFAIDGVPVGIGELTSIMGGSWESEPWRQLTGILDSGELLDNDFKIGNSASIVLIPEPSLMILLVGLVLRLKRK